MNIIDLSKMISRLGIDSESILKILQEEYKKCGDECVIETFKELTGLDIESLSRGHYVFKYYNNESTKYIDDEHKNLVNLARRLEYNLNKYFNSKKVTDRNHVWVTPHYNYSTPGYIYHTDYDISFRISERDEKLFNFLSKITGKRNTFSYELSKEQAERLLVALKTDFAEENAEKYNL